MKHTGFTLLETLMVLGISAVIGVILVSIVVQSGSYFTNQNSEIANNISLNSINTELQQGIQDASSIAAAYGQYSSSATTVIAVYPSLTANGQIIDNKFDTVIITQDTTKPNLLRKYVFADSTSSRKNENQILTANLAYLQFIYLNDQQTVVSPASAKRIDFVIKVAEKNGVNSKESSASGRINLKNV